MATLQSNNGNTIIIAIEISDRYGVPDSKNETTLWKNKYQNVHYFNLPFWYPLQKATLQSNNGNMIIMHAVFYESVKGMLTLLHK